MENSKDYIGSVFTSNAGFKFEIVEYRSNTEILVRFVDSGFERAARLSDIKRGRVRDFFAPTVFGVGFNGIGRHKSKISGKHTRAYTTWRNILLRCYCKKFVGASYDNCTVDSEWHNFQNYADWHEKNYPQDGGDYQIDKDIRSCSEKIYSKDTCMFVTQAQNLEAVDNKKPVKLINKITGEIKSYTSCRKAESDLGLAGGSISRLLSGKTLSAKQWAIA